MGIKRIKEVMDHAPEDLTPAERLILLVVAEDIRDEDPGRQTWPKFNAALLARRTGLTGKGSLKDALQRLARRGLEIRVPLTVGKDGRPVYAVPGKQCKYRLPVFEGEVTASPGEVTTSPKERSQPRLERSEPPPTPLPSGTPPPSLSEPPADPAPPPVADPQAGREGGGIAALPEDQQRAYRILAGITARTPRLVVGEQELLHLLPYAVPWLDRSTPQGMEAALTNGLPQEIGNPAGLLRMRLEKKLPPEKQDAATRNGLPRWCGQCGDGNPAAEHNPRFRRIPQRDGPDALCEACHPDVAARAA